MSISYSRPLSLAWARMKKALFQPFDLNKWIRIGFTAWLAGFTDCNGGGGNGSNIGKKGDWDDFFDFPQTAWQWLMDNPFYFNLIIFGLVILFVVITVITWVSSRGKFMFLYNVAKDKTEISKPWHTFRKQGNSLFIWEFVFGWFAFAVFMVFLGYCFVTAKNLYEGNFLKVEIFGAVAKMVLVFIAILIVFGYISLFLKDFVVPIMYKYRVGVIKGWQKFLALLAKKFFVFIIYGLFIFVLGIAVGFGVLLAGLLTCCIGLLIIALPFVGAVILLPISYTFRALSIEFLAQFGDDYNVFPTNETKQDLNDIVDYNTHIELPDDK